MPGVNDNESVEFEAQDRAESYDETNLSDYGEQRRTFEEMDDVYDVTRAADDADEAGDDRALDASDYDADELGDEEIEEDEDDVAVHARSDRLETGDDFDEDDPGDDTIEGLRIVADAGRVEGGEDDVTNFQSRGLADEDIERLGYAAAGGKPIADKPKPNSPHSPEDVEDERDPHTEKNLDEGVEETFPASDPVSISPGAD